MGSPRLSGAAEKTREAYNGPARDARKEQLAFGEDLSIRLKSFLFRIFGAFDPLTTE